MKPGNDFHKMCVCYFYFTALLHMLSSKTWLLLFYCVSSRRQIAKFGSFMWVLNSRFCIFIYTNVLYISCLNFIKPVNLCVLSTPGWHKSQWSSVLVSNYCIMLENYKLQSIWSAYVRMFLLCCNSNPCYEQITVVVHLQHKADTRYDGYIF